MRTLFIPLIIFIIAFSSCGDDDEQVNPVTPPGTVLYSNDSISVWLQQGVSSSGIDSVYFSTQNTGGVKIEYTIQSNADSSDHSAGFYGIYSNATPAIVYFPNIYSPINEQHSSNFNFAQGSTYFAFSVRLVVNNSSMTRYVRLINIKVTKL